MPVLELEEEADFVDVADCEIVTVLVGELVRVPVFVSVCDAVPVLEDEDVRGGVAVLDTVRVCEDDPVSEFEAEEEAVRVSEAD